MHQAPAPWKTVFNFACIYLVWGSTYLAIKYALVGIPPFLLASLRYLLAAAVLVVISKLRKEQSLAPVDIKLAILSGCLLTMGNALVCVSETSLPSGMVAVVVGTMPVWITLINWQLFQGAKPKIRQLVGVLIALAGVAMLTRAQSDHIENIPVYIWFAMFSSLMVWAFGTLIQRRSTQRMSLFGFSGLQLGCGGLMLLVVWSIFEGPSSVVIADINGLTIASVVYLALFGSVLASTSYLWLNQNHDPTMVSTYALVNPVVAVWLGWLFVGETVTPFTLLYSLLVLIGLYLVVLSGRVLRVTPK